MHGIMYLHDDYMLSGEQYRLRLKLESNKNSGQKAFLRYCKHLIGKQKEYNMTS